MNLGARRSSGPILLFLHADTLLPAGWPEAVRQALADPGVSLAAFRLRFRRDEPCPPGLSVLARFVDLRAGWLGLPLGDQGLALRRSTFLALGGFPQEPLLEDLIMVRRARGLGRVAVMDPPVLTSARRWRRRGLLRTTLLNNAILLAHLAGVSPSRLARWYG